MNTTDVVPGQNRVTRRDALRGLGGVVGAALVGGCSAASVTSAATTDTSTTGTTTGTTSASACVASASETEGPYPDKTGMLGNSAFFRRDITEGKAGVPLALTLTVVNVNANCAVVPNANVEIWQCDATGFYSEYSQPGYDGTGKTYLRGLQATDAAGKVQFTTIYPGWYAGRATHIHAEVFVNGQSVKVTQVAFPEAITAAVYASGVYAAKGQNTTTNATDNVFSDGTATEMATVSGSVTAGYTAALQIGVAL